MRPTQKSVRGWGFTAVLVLLVVSFVSCKYELVKEPTHNFNEKKNAADYNDYILPPKNITASQGLKCAVELEWEVVPNAVQYYIYSAATPYDTFQKVSETKADETEISIDEESGITKYYCVSAVNYYGTISSKSIVVSGSTLAVPIITEITASEDGNCVEVGWWMDNCNAGTYEGKVSFEVSVYENATSSVKYKSLTADGTKRLVRVEGLTSAKEYYFVVEVKNLEAEITEKSSKTSAQTAHRVIPDSPAGFTVSQGESKNDITLSWNLPAGAWYQESSGASGFVLHPVYFSIYRKESNQSDDKYKVIANAYVKANNDWKNRKKLNTENPLNIELSITDNSNKKLEAPYESYIPYAEVAWKDTATQRGKKYTYYIQSITDDSPEGKYITTDSCKTEPVEGWTINEALFSVRADYQKANESDSNFSSVNLSYNALFETYGKDYTYFVEQEWSQIPESRITFAEPKTIFRFDSISELNSSGRFFNNLQESEGYYKYTLYICTNGSADNTNPIETVTNAEIFPVTPTVTIPNINNFTVEDGYSDYYKLSWNYDAELAYTIIWKDVTTGIEDSKIIENSELTSVSNGIATYDHPAVSGDRRIYTLKASKGLVATKTASDAEGNPIVYETLGTPSISISSYEYDKICIEWPAVQKVEGDNKYTVTAKYKDDTNNLTYTSLEIIEPTEQDDKYYCIITNPSGYDKVEKSGKTIECTVTAKNTKAHTDNTIDVCTVGPALTNMTIPEQKSKDRIIVKWTPVQGAQGYIIRRITYKDKSAYKPKDILVENLEDEDFIDVYYFDGSKLLMDNQTVNNERANVVKASDGNFILTDIYKEVDDASSSYERNQSAISWGIPFGYVVLPVKEGGNSNDFTYDGRAIKLSQNAIYADIKEQYGATYGYGLSVHAKKSESSDTQVIEWHKPYNATENPDIYYREFNTNEWVKIQLPVIQDLDGGKQKTAITPKNLLKAYEYCVTYNKGQVSFSINQSFANDTIVGLSINEDSYNYQGLIQEKANKGYLLNVNYTAKQGTDQNIQYSEQASWEPWDYNYRSIGPAKAYVQILNYNISTNWTPVAELYGDLKFNKSANVENTTVTQSSQNDPYTITIKPTVLMDGSLENPITKGPLMVLRDAKHYYSLKLYYGEDDDKSVTITTNDKGSVYAYRDISQKELVKCALLNMAYGFYLDGGGNEDLSNVGNQLKYSNFSGTGCAEFNNREFAPEWDHWDKYTANSSMDLYKPNLLNPSNRLSNVVIITYPKTQINVRGAGSTYYFLNFTETCIITVNKVDEKMPDSYSGTINMSCTGVKNLSVSVNNQEIINVNDKDLRRVYFPAQISSFDNKLDEKHCWIKDSTYGWWPEN